MFFNTTRKKHRKLRRLWWVGGDPEVTPSWSAAGAARHYNLRLPTEGLRQGHGPAAMGRRPDLRATAHAADPSVGPLQQGGGVKCEGRCTSACNAEQALGDAAQASGLQRWTSVGWRCTSVGVATLNKRVCNAEQAFWNAAQACLQRWASALGGWSWQSRPLAKTLAPVQVEKLTAMRVGNPHRVVFVGKNKAKLSRIFFLPFFRYLGFSRPTPRKRNESRSDISRRLRSRPPASQAKRCVAPMPR